MYIYVYIVYVNIAGFTPDWNEGGFLCVLFSFCCFFWKYLLNNEIGRGEKRKEITENQRLDSRVVFNCENHKRKKPFH